MFEILDEKMSIYAYYFIKHLSKSANTPTIARLKSLVDRIVRFFSKKF